MPTKDGLAPDHPLPLFLTEHADKPDVGKPWDKAVISSRTLKASILVVTALVIAVLLLGNPVALFANVTASLVDILGLQPGAGQSTPTIQSASDAPALPPTAATEAPPARQETAAVLGPADQGQTENSEPPTEALFKQFQAWAARNPLAQVAPAQPVQDAPARLVQNAPAQVAENARAPVRLIRDHRYVRPVQNARAEIQPVQNPRKRIRRQQNARVQVAPAQDARAQDQPGQNTETPSFLQSLGLRN